MKIAFIYLVGLLAMIPSELKSSISHNTNKIMKDTGSKTVVFAGGCFRCTEAIFDKDEDQKLEAIAYKAKFEKEKIWSAPIVTEITKFEKFYPAENYHQEYYQNNPNQGYCRIVITPKIEKFKKIFADKLK